MHLLFCLCNEDFNYFQDAYLNSMVKVYEASAETLDNYSVLIEAAKESAEEQVRQLALSVVVNQHQVTVDFRGN